jgi:hypothetical protein
MAGQNRSNTAKMANLVLRKTVERLEGPQVARLQTPEKLTARDESSGRLA